VNLYAAGNTTRQIATALGRTVMAMKTFIANHREKFPPRNNSGMDAKERVLHALRINPDISAVAASLSWHTKTVDRWARLFVKTGELAEMPKGVVYRRHFTNDPDLSPMAKYLADRLWRYKSKDKYRNNSRFKQFNLHGVWIEDQLKKQDYKCYYTGLDMSLDPKSTMYVSIDRVDSNIGYRQDNCVLCCCIVNKAKNTLSKEKFILMCHAVANTYPLRT
jgi:hypothetical protein